MIILIVQENDCLQEEAFCVKFSNSHHSVCIDLPVHICSILPCT